MRTLSIGRGGKIIIDDSPVDINQLENKSEFLSSILLLDLELSDDINVADMVHFFYDAKDFIKDVLSEEYEVARALITSSSVSKNYKKFRVYKSFKIEKEIFNNNEEFIYLIPEIELMPSGVGEDGVRNVGSLPIVIDETIKLVHEDFETGDIVTIQSRTKITLLDLMTCIFDELPSLIKEGLL